MVGFERLQAIAQNVGNFVADLSASRVVVCVEGYAYGNAFTLVTLTEIGTAIRLSLFSRKIPWYDVPPTVVKKFATGKGNAKKSEVAVAVASQWKFESRSDDVVDAFVLAKLAQHIVCNGVPSNWKGVSYHGTE